MGEKHLPRNKCMVVDSGLSAVRGRFPAVRCLHGAHWLCQLHASVRCRSGCPEYSLHRDIFCRCTRSQSARPVSQIRRSNNMCALLCSVFRMKLIARRPSKPSSPVRLVSWQLASSSQVNVLANCAKYNISWTQWNTIKHSEVLKIWCDREWSRLHNVYLLQNSSTFRAIFSNTAGLLMDNFSPVILTYLLSWKWTWKRKVLPLVLKRNPILEPFLASDCGLVHCVKVFEDTSKLSATER